MRFGYSKFQKANIFFGTIITLLPHHDLNLKIAITPGHCIALELSQINKQWPIEVALCCVLTFLLRYDRGAARAEALAQMHRARRRPPVCCLASAGAAAPGTGGRPAGLCSALAAPCRAALRPCQLPQMRLASARCSGPPLGTKAAAPAVSGPASAYRQPPLGFAACVGASAELRTKSREGRRAVSIWLRGGKSCLGCCKWAVRRGVAGFEPKTQKKIGRSVFCSVISYFFYTYP